MRCRSLRFTSLLDAEAFTAADYAAAALLLALYYAVSYSPELGAGAICLNAKEKWVQREQKFGRN